MSTAEGSLKYRMQNKLKDQRLESGRDPKTGDVIKDEKVLEELRADWEENMPDSMKEKKEQAKEDLAKDQEQVKG